MRTTASRKAAVAAGMALALCSATAYTAEGATDFSRSKARGELISAEALYTLTTPQDVTSQLESLGFQGDSVRYGVDAYRLVYSTVDAHGSPTTASGLLVLPHDFKGTLKPVSYGHGSELFDKDAPSTDPQGFNAAAPVTYAAAGFAGIAADYLGQGTGPGTHPWLDVPSETSATLDMLRAAREFVPRTGSFLKRDVLATGFSQGAEAALGLGRALQQGEDPRFRLAALAPVSGAYAVRDAEIPAMLSGEVSAKVSVLNVAYSYAAFDRTYDVYDKPTDVFKEPYADKVEGLTDGQHNWQELAVATPGTLDELLTAKGRDLIEHPQGNLDEALRAADNSCKGWAPQVPRRMYFTSGDDQAVNANIRYCLADFMSQGAKFPTVDVQSEAWHGSRHFGSNVAATSQIVKWFLSL
ncbi:lipase [Streptomyces atratus]|uniref:lipase n=1 Tax=Streptomyces atratus TaxID=1893 RepID=UPI0033C54116